MNKNQQRVQAIKDRLAEIKSNIKAVTKIMGQPYGSIVINFADRRKLVFTGSRDMDCLLPHGSFTDFIDRQNDERERLEQELELLLIAESYPAIDGLIPVVIPPGEGATIHSGQGVFVTNASDVNIIVYVKG